MFSDKEDSVTRENDKDSQSSHPKKQKPMSVSRQNEIRELFETVYLTNKWSVVFTNFWRGLAFGLGTFLGGTVVVAITVWIWSQTIDIFPWAKQLIEFLKR